MPCFGGREKTCHGSRLTSAEPGGSFGPVTQADKPIGVGRAPIYLQLSGAESEAGCGRRVLPRRVRMNPTIDKGFGQRAHLALSLSLYHQPVVSPSAPAASQGLLSSSILRHTLWQVRRNQDRKLPLRRSSASSRWRRPAADVFDLSFYFLGLSPRRRKGLISTSAGANSPAHGRGALAHSSN
jgi:hypothetical protein